MTQMNQLISSKPNSKLPSEYLTKHIRKNLFKLRPKSSSYSKCYLSIDYKELAQKQMNTTCQLNMFKADKIHRGENFIVHRTKRSQSSKIKKPTTLELKDKKYEQHSSSLRQYLNKNKFLQKCKHEQDQQTFIRNIDLNGKVTDTLEIRQKQLHQLVDVVIEGNIFFQRLQRTLIESLFILGGLHKYEKGRRISMGKSPLIGFILYGKCKYFNQDFSCILSKTNVLGETDLIRTSDQNCRKDKSAINQQMSIKFLDDSCILWLTYTHYHILREQSIKQGLRQQFIKLETQIRHQYFLKKNQKFINKPKIDSSK